MTADRRLFLVRHGHVDRTSRDFRPTPRGRQWDPPLDELGREQAERLADRLLLMEPPPALYASPFRRTSETIRPFAEKAGLEVVVDEDLGEVFVGRWEGESFEEILSENEELARRFRDQEAMFGLSPGGESGEALRRRVGRAVERMFARSPGRDVVAVTHGGVINAALSPLVATRQDMFFLPENASINTVLADDDRRSIRFLNDVRHLTDPGLFLPPAGA